ncbi:Fic family protein [Rudaea sp.]|uniref:Fic family protein n=1 Tax=Rudaea sp. TaxID=2136325 RepID=UPI002F95F174
MDDDRNPISSSPRFGIALAANAAHNLRMKRGDYEQYIWQAKDWPNWRYDLQALAAPLVNVSHAQGLLLGRLADLGALSRNHASLAALTDDVVKTSAIEGDSLNVVSVRSSIARRLGVDIGALAPVDRHVEGVVDMVLDATTRYREPLTAKRLFGWHAALFPTGHSGLRRIRVGAWRDDANGPMQVVSGPVHREKVHYQAPPANRLKIELKRFFDWANDDSGEPVLIKAGLAHLWFVTLHPFDDGNGRIARAIGDLFLARADGSPQRFYSLSAQIQRSRRDYYDVLERTQKILPMAKFRASLGRHRDVSAKDTLDVTEWLAWFLDALGHAIVGAQTSLDGVLGKARFWRRSAGTPMNERQAKVLNRLLDSFEGKLTSRKWAAIAKCSADTALRDITELMGRGILRKTSAGGRSTAYELAPDATRSD